MSNGLASGHPSTSMLQAPAALNTQRVLEQIALALVLLLFIAPFVIPVHRAPQATFDMEWLAATLLAGAALALGLMRAVKVTLAWPVWTWLGAMVAIAAVQYASGRFVYSSQLLLACVYAFAAAGAYWVGCALLARDLRERALQFACWAMLAGAVFSVAIQWLQLFDVKDLPWWLYFQIVDPWFRTRPFANLAQANLLSTYFIWSFLGVLYLNRRPLPAVASVALVFVIAMGLALTRSRMGIVFSGVVLAAFWLPWALRPAARSDRIAMTVALLLGYVAGSAAVSILVAYQGVAVDTALQRFSERGGLGVRLVMWTDALKVAATAPWLGVGFGGYALAQYTIAEAVAHVQPTVYVHNIVLQTAAEMGWPLAIALAAIGAWWALAQFGERIRQRETALAWAMLLFMGVHAMLEWPLASLHFAIPTILLFALAEPGAGLFGRRTIEIDSRMLVLAGAAGVLLAVPMKLEFDEASEVVYRAEVERRTDSGVSENTVWRLLALSDASRMRVWPDQVLVFLRRPDAVDPTDEEIRKHERLLILGADPRLVARLVIVTARAGRIEESVHHAQRLRVFNRGTFADMRQVILEALEALGAAADPVRRELADDPPDLR